MTYIADSAAQDAAIRDGCAAQPFCAGRRAVLGCALALGLSPLLSSTAQAATKPKWYVVGATTKFTASKPILVKLLSGRAAFFVVKQTLTRYQCVWAGCTHQGDLLDWNPNHPKYFHCSAHGARFALTGKVMKGPARRPLPLLPTRVNKGKVEVDLSVTGLV